MANDVVESIHDPMPVILEREAESTWLTAEMRAERQAILKPHPPDDLHAYPVSKRVNNPQNDTADLLVERDGRYRVASARS